jgi:uncharacterized protein (TIGR02246 family)
MTDTEARLRRLEDERAIVDVLYAYTHAVDYNLEEEFVDCFAEDATLHWKDALVGRAAIREAFRAHMHPEDVFHKHLTLEPRVEVDGDRATARSYLVYIDDSPEGPRIRSYGRYRDAFVRCADGRWRFYERASELEARRA